MSRKNNARQSTGNAAHYPVSLDPASIREYNPDSLRPEDFDIVRTYLTESGKPGLHIIRVGIDADNPAEHHFILTRTDFIPIASTSSQQAMERLVENEYCLVPRPTRLARTNG